MAQIALQKYLNQIDQLIEEHRLVEAVAHCRHILTQHPRHVETYRLLGKALLEQREYEAAADILQRVLSTTPDDFLAHAGLAIIHTESGEVPRAIWHMERAFEVEPYNPAIREELRELYAQRDGLKPERVALTRGALARIYMRGDVHPQDVMELRGILQDDPDRIDVETMLAEALWRNELRMEAVEVCLSILDKLPNCIKANAILAEIWHKAGRTTEAQRYVQRLQSLTLMDQTRFEADTLVGRALAANGQVNLPEVMLVEELDYLPTVDADQFGDADWVRELQTTTTPKDDVPEWLQEFGSRDEVAQEPAGMTADDEDSFEWPEATDRSSELQGFKALSDVVIDSEMAEGSVQELDDFDFDAGVEPAVTQQSEDGLDESPSTAETAEPSAAIDDSRPFDTGELAEWFSEQDDGDAEAPIGPDEIPQWLAEADSGKEGKAPAGTVDETGASDEVPEWLETSAPGDVGRSSEAAVTARYETASADLEGANDDLEEQAMGDPEVPLNGQQDDSNDSEEAANWLEELAAQQEAGSAAGEAVPDDEDSSGAGEPDDELPDWLNMGLEHSAPTEDDLPDWLGEEIVSSDETEDIEGTVTGAEETLISATPVVQPGEEMPDWLRDKMPDDLEEGAESEFDESLSWLDQIAGGEGAAIDEPLTMDWEEEGDSGALEISESDLPEDTSWLDELAQVSDEPVDETVVAASPLPYETTDDLPGDKTSIEAVALAESGAEPDQAAPDQVEADLERVSKVDDALEFAEALEQIPEAPEDPDDAMEWLEQLAAKQGAPLEELPSVSETDELEATIVSELPSFEESELAESLEDEAGPWDLAAELAQESVAKVEPIDEGGDLSQEIPDDPDEAMAWLEQLAAQQGAPLEELPSLTEEPFEPAEVDEIPETGVDTTFEAALDEVADVEMPADSAQAMAWLEQLANKAFGPPSTEVVEEPATPAGAQDVESARAEAETELLRRETEEAAELEAAISEMPEDPDVAMAWLEQLAARQGAPLEELATVDTVAEDVETPDWIAEEVEQRELEQEAPETAVTEAPPEVAELIELDEWEPGPVDEAIPSIDEVEELIEGISPPTEAEAAEALPEVGKPIELDEWEAGPVDEDVPTYDEVGILFEETSPPADEAEIEAEAATLEPEGPALAMDPAEPLAAEIEAPAVEVETPGEDELPARGPDMEASDADEAMPDWLGLEDAADAVDADLDWLDSLDESAGEGWLESEEQATLTDLKIPDQVAETTEPPVSLMDAETVAPEIVPDVEFDSPDLEQLQVPAEGTEQPDQERLTVARAAMEAGKIEAALEAYSSLVDEGQGIAMVIADLETAVTKRESPSSVWKLLGDAYAQNGQLQKALEIYREALDHL